MGGFLQGLKELLWSGHDEPNPGGTPYTPTTQPDGTIAPTSGPSNTPDSATHVRGLLPRLGSWAMSPEGMLAIGTTLRAGTGNEGAFGDQARIQESMRQGALQARALKDAQAKNDAFNQSWETDDKGKRTFSNDLYQQNLAKAGYKGDMVSAVAGAKALRDKFTFDEVDGNVLRHDESGGTEIVGHANKPIKVPGGTFVPHTTFQTGAEGPDLGAALGGSGSLPAPGTETRDTSGNTVPPPPAPPTEPQTARTPITASPDDVKALAWMIQQEAGHEPQQGRIAAGSVALNRLASGYGGAKSLRDVVMAPHQFEGVGGHVGEASPEFAQLAQGLISGQFGDPTGGADQFLNPELQVKGWAGRPGQPIPKWAQGEGQRIGNHVFYGGDASKIATAAPVAAAAAGQPAAATAPASAGRPTPQLPGYSFVPDGKEWTDMSPEEAAAHGALSGQRNLVTNEYKLSGEGKAGQHAKLPAQLLGQQKSLLEDIGAADSNAATATKYTNQINKGLLKLGIVPNTTAAVRNTAGISTPQSRNYSSFRADLEKMRNDSLRLNKGVQTEGDAVRAWNELMKNLNDKDVVLQRLGEINDINTRAIDLRKDILNQLRTDSGLDPIDDWSKFQKGPKVGDPGAGPTRRHYDKAGNLVAQ